MPKFQNNNTAFVRWGDIPPNERSRRYDRKTRGCHAGTSCYHATFQNGVWVIRDSHLTLNGYETVTVLLHANPARPILLLDGQIVGTGPDNEPLIKKITTLKTLSREEISFPHLDNPDEKKKLQARRDFKTWGSLLPAGA
jgi:hypothetical protein